MGDVTFSACVCRGHRTHRDPRSRCLRPTEPRAAVPCPVPGLASSCPFSPPRPATAGTPGGLGFDFKFYRSSCLTFVCCLETGITVLGERRVPSGATAGSWHSPSPAPRGSKMFLLLWVAFCSRAVIAWQGAGAQLRGDLAVLLPRWLLFFFPAFEHPCSLQSILAPLHRRSGALHARLVQHTGGSPPASQKDADGAFSPSPVPVDCAELRQSRALSPGGRVCTRNCGGTAGFTCFTRRIGAGSEAEEWSCYTSPYAPGCFPCWEPLGLHINPPSAATVSQMSQDMNFFSSFSAGVKLNYGSCQH